MALILLFAGRPDPGTEPPADSPPRTVTVMGEGEKRVKPDQVTLTFGIAAWTQGASAAEAEALALASVLTLTEAVQRAGVEAGSVQAAQPLVTPLTRQDYAGKTYMTGFQSAAQVVVRVTNLARADAVIAAGLANGATSLDSVVYGLAEPEAARREAVQAAIANARERAADIVTSQDRTLGEMLSVEVVQEELQGTTPGSQTVRARVVATFGY